MIEVKNLSFKYDKEDVLKNLSFSINDKESVGIIGANGTGKTTLLKLFVGLNNTYQGDIIIDGIKLDKTNTIDIKRKCGYLFQDSDNQLFMNKVYDDVAFGPTNLDNHNVDNTVNKVLNDLNINHLKDRNIHTLSGGEKKLVSIAGIMALNPEYIFMDEPSIALDPKNRRNIINIINSLNCTKVITSHDLDLIYDTCSKIILMNNGRIIKIGSKDEILKDKKLLEDNDLELPLSFKYN